MDLKVAILTGISGMDAESLAHILLSKGYTVIGTYRKNACIDLEQIQKGYNFNSNLHLTYCDIDDYNSCKTLISYVLEKFGKIDELYLLAAQSNVGFSFNSEASTVWTDGMSVFNFLDSIRLLSPKTKTYFAATSELLGGDPSRCPFDENSEYECRSPYAIGKELATRWVKYFQQTYGIFVTYNIIFNHSNTSRKKDFFIRRVTNMAARIALGKEKELPLGSLDFYRDETWSDFVMEATWQTLQLEKPEVFLLCRGECHSGEQFLTESFNYFNLDWKKYVTLDKNRLRVNDVKMLVGNPKKAVDKLGWRPNRMSFKDHIRLMADFDYKLESGQNPVRPNVFELFP